MLDDKENPQAAPHHGAAVPGADGIPGSRYLPYAAAFLACVFASLASYPGFMSYDSLEALRQAREQVEGGPYPPFGMYVWRVLDAIWPGPTLMQFAQNGLLLFSFAYIVRKIRLPVYLQLVSIGIFALLPPILGIMLVVWKDVAVAACLLAAFAISLFADARLAHRNLALGTVIVLLFSGMAYRYNAASAVFPLAAYLAYGVIRKGSERMRILKSLVAGTGLTLALFAMVLFVDSHRFPSLEKLRPTENMSYTQNYDLVGISAHAPVSVYPDGSGGYVPVDYLRKIYDPVHLNKTMDNDHMHLLHTPENVSAVWLQAIRQYPRAYFQHRSDVFGEFVDFHHRPVFYPTHPFVDANKFGITYTPTRLGNMTVDYVNKAAQGWVSRPWIYFDAGLAFLAILYLFKIRMYRLEATVVYASGILYVLPMYFITPAADLRYSFWSICASVVVVILALTAIFRERILHTTSVPDGENHPHLR